MPDARQPLLLRGLDAAATAAVAAATDRAVAEGWVAPHLGPRRHAVVAGPGRAGDHPPAAGLARPAPRLQRPHRRAGGAGRRPSCRGVPPRARVRHGRQLARAVGHRRGLAARPGRHRRRGPGLDRPVAPCTPRPSPATPARRSTSSPASRARPSSRPASRPTSGSSRRSAYGRFPSDAAGEHFAIITDPGHSLDHFPHREAYRTVLLNPPDVGGRYSALTYVGLAPAALQGVALDPLLDEAMAMAAGLPAARCGQSRAGPGGGARGARPGRARQGHVHHRARHRPLRGVGRAAHRREHRQAGHRPGADRRRAARRARGVHRRPGLRAPGAGRCRPATPPGAAPPTRPWRALAAAGHPVVERGHAGRPGGRVLPLGVRHGGGRRRAGREPLR